MAVIRDWEFPEDLYYQIEKHVWVRVMEDGRLRIGLTPAGYALLRHTLTAISIRQRNVGQFVPKGKSVAMVESLKYIGPLAAPVAGTLLGGNDLVQAAPDVAPEDPYGDGWLVELQPENWERDRPELLTGDAAMAAYEKWLSQEKIGWE